MSEASTPASVCCVTCIWFLPFPRKCVPRRMDAHHEATSFEKKGPSSARPMFECCFDWLKGVSWVLFSEGFLRQLAFGNLFVEHLSLRFPFEVFHLLQTQSWKSIACMSLVLCLSVVRGWLSCMSTVRDSSHGLPVHRAFHPCAC